MMFVELETSPLRCVGTRHQRYLGQTDNFDLAVSRLLIMDNQPDITLDKIRFNNLFFMETRARQRLDAKPVVAWHN